MYLKLPPEKLEKLLNYLKDKPWVEVAQLIIELTNLEKEEIKESKETNKQ